MTDYVTIGGASFKILSQSLRKIKNWDEVFWTLGPKYFYRLKIEKLSRNAVPKKFICQKNYERLKLFDKQFDENIVQDDEVPRMIFDDFPAIAKFCERQKELTEKLCNKYSDNLVALYFCQSSAKTLTTCNEMKKTVSNYRYSKLDLITAYNNYTLKVDFCMVVQESLHNCSFENEKTEAYCNKLHVIYSSCLSFKFDSSEPELSKNCWGIRPLLKGSLYIMDTTEIVVYTAEEARACYVNPKCENFWLFIGKLIFRIIVLLCRIVLLIDDTCSLGLELIPSLSGACKSVNFITKVCKWFIKLAPWLEIVYEFTYNLISYVIKGHTLKIDSNLCLEISCESKYANDSNCKYIQKNCISFIGSISLEKKSAMIAFDQPINKLTTPKIVESSLKIENYCRMFCTLIKEFTDDYCNFRDNKHLKIIFCKSFAALINNCKKYKMIKDESFLNKGIKRFGPPKITTRTTKKPTAQKPTKLSFCEQIFLYYDRNCKKLFKNLCKSVKIFNSFCLQLDDQIAKKNDSIAFKPTDYDLILMNFAKNNSISLKKKLDQLIFVYEESYLEFSNDTEIISNVEMPNQYYNLLRHEDSNYELLQFSCRMIEFYYKKRSCEIFNSSCCLLRPSVTLIVKYCRKYINYEVLEHKSLIKLDSNVFLYNKFCIEFSSEQHCLTLNPEKCMLNKNGCVQFISRQIFPYVFNF